MENKINITNHKLSEAETESRKNYAGKFSINGKTFSYYTKRQMKSLYPDKNYKLIAEYAPGSKKKATGKLKSGDMELPTLKHGASSRIIYSERGCVAVGGEDRFIVLLKNVLLPRILALVAAIAVITCGILLILNSGKGSVAAISDEPLSLGGRVPQLEENAVPWQGVQTDDTGSVTPGIAIPGYKSITIDAGKTEVDVNLQNPEGNPCYFVISLLLEDGTVLYQSDMVEPGMGLYSITLTRSLERGEYNASVKYDTFSLSDLSPMNGAEVKIKLIVK